MHAVAVGGKPAGEAEIRAAARDEVQHASADDPTEDLCHDVRQQQGGWKTSSDAQTDGHSGVEVTARDRAECVRP